jgi:hypothetical protein
MGIAFTRENVESVANRTARLISRHVGAEIIEFSPTETLPRVPGPCPCPPRGAQIRQGRTPGHRVDSNPDEPL